jgi:hypothetical protein
MNCEVCGKEGMNEENNHCYGCGHIICNECCIDEDGDLIIGHHTLSSHKKAHQKKKAKP